jgi:hypothetical protein
MSLITIDYKSLQAVNENGMSMRAAFELDESNAIKLLIDMKKLLPFVAKYQYKRFRSVMKQICFAFGPEFDHLYGNF